MSIDDGLIPSKIMVFSDLVGREIPAAFTYGLENWGWNETDGHYLHKEDEEALIFEYAWLECEGHVGHGDETVYCADGAICPNSLHKVGQIIHRWKANQ